MQGQMVKVKMWIGHGSIAKKHKGVSIDAKFAPLLMVEDLQKMFKVSTKPIKKAPFWGSMILAWEENLRCVKPHPVARVTSSHNERLDNSKRNFIRRKYC